MQLSCETNANCHNISQMRFLPGEVESRPGSALALAFLQKLFPWARHSTNVAPQMVRLLVKCFGFLQGVYLITEVTKKEEKDLENYPSNHVQEAKLAGIDRSRMDLEQLHIKGVRCPISSLCSAA